jgi:hypothetical protein
MRHGGLSEAADSLLKPDLCVLSMPAFDGEAGQLRAADRMAQEDATSPDYSAPASRTRTYVEEPLPDRIGNYEIKRKIGAGGMGTVYLAVQGKPAPDGGTEGHAGRDCVADGAAAV